MKELSFAYGMILVRGRIHEARVCYNRKSAKNEKKLLYL